MSQVFKEGNVIGKHVARVHRGGNRIDGVSHDPEVFYNDLPIPKRSKIDLSFDRKVSFDMAQLVPILAQECVPGDTFHIAQAHNLMFAPLISPVFQRIDYRTYYFFVPTRLVDDAWRDFITLKDTNYVLPYFTGSMVDSAGMVAKNSLFDYFDLPVQQSQFTDNVRHLCAHVFRSYNLIYNEYFRDEFKQTEIPITKTGGNISATELATYTVKNIGWERDYFTIAQTSPQMGADVSLPVGITNDGSFSLQKSIPGNIDSGNLQIYNLTPSHNGVVLDNSGNSTAYNSGLKTTGTINDLRIANHLQELRDRFKIGGARYNESILSEYGVVVPDYRVQRPEYIGGFASPVEIGRVMQNSETATTPLGTYAGSAQSKDRMDYIHYNCLEHGYIIGLCTVMPRSSYDQGIPRMFIKDDFFDYYHPDLATLGDEQIYNDEIFVSNNSGGNVDNSRFGYVPRYLSYKMNNDRINGEFRDNLSFWHMSREFNSLPALNGSFVEGDPTKRIFATQNLANNIYAEIYQQIDSVRPMPVSVQPNLTNVE